MPLYVSTVFVQVFKLPCGLRGGEAHCAEAAVHRTSKSSRSHFELILRVGARIHRMSESVTKYTFTKMGRARGSGGFSSDAAAFHPKFQNFLPRTPFCCCFWAQLFESLQILAFFQARRKRCKSPQKRQCLKRCSALIRRFVGNWCFAGLLQHFLRACTRSANSYKFGRFKPLGLETKEE